MKSKLEAQDRDLIHILLKQDKLNGYCGNYRPINRYKKLWDIVNGNYIFRDITKENNHK